MYTDPMLIRIMDEIETEAIGAGLTRLRGGVAHSTAWAERSGRPDGTTWYELRMHHMSDGSMTAGVLAYLPVARGGGTLEIGRSGWEADDEAAITGLIEDIRIMLAAIMRRRVWEAGGRRWERRRDETGR